MVGALGWILSARLLVEPIQPYGWSGAEYLEHLDRLRAVMAWRTIGPGHPLELIRAVDPGFPPGLHLVGGPFGAIFGHSAETVAWSGLLWLVPLGLAVGSVVVSLDPWSGPPRQAWVTRLAGITAAVLLPAVHAASTRYHYDLPLAALIWCAVAVQLRYQDERPLAGGAVAGLLLFAAGLVKWAALPLGAPALAACWLAPHRVVQTGAVRRRTSRRAAALGTAALVSGLLLAGFLSISSHSFSMMAGSTFGAADDATSVVIFDDGVVAGLRATVERVVEGLPPHPGRRLVDYGFHVVTAMLSPLLTVALVVCGVAWLGSGAPGLLMMTAAMAGQLAFLVLGVPPMDERFLLPALPWAAVLAVLGWRGFHSRSRTGAGAVLAGLALLIAWDVHHGEEGGWNQLVHVRESTTEFPHTQARGISLESSFNQLGWARRDEPGVDRRAQREEVWRTALACEPRDLLVDGTVIDARGTAIWWAYREQLATIEGIADPPHAVPLRGPDAMRVDPNWALVVTGRGALPAVAVLDGAWEVAARIPEPGGSDEVRLWRRVGRPLCTQAGGGD